MTEADKVMKEVSDKLKEIPELDNFFLTLTTKVEDTLHHYQACMNFPSMDCIPSLEAIGKLVMEEKPEIQRTYQMNRKFN